MTPHTEEAKTDGFSFFYIELSYLLFTQVMLYHLHSNQ